LRARAAAPGVTTGCRKGRGAPPPAGEFARVEAAVALLAAYLALRPSESWTRSDGVEDGVEGDGDAAGASTPTGRPL